MICPGDILAGDADGILVIKPEEAEELAARAKEVHVKEAGQLDGILTGKGWFRPWVDEILDEIGVGYID